MQTSICSFTSCEDSPAFGVIVICTFGLADYLAHVMEAEQLDGVANLWIIMFIVCDYNGSSFVHREVINDFSLPCVCSK